MRRHCQRLFPSAELLEPRFLFNSTADWRAKWPGTVARIDALIFFHGGDPDWIGAGVFGEVRHAFELGKRVWHLDDGGHLHPFEAVRLEVAPTATMTKFARVRLVD